MSDCSTTAVEGDGYTSDASVVSNTTQGTELSPNILCGLNMLAHTPPKRRKVADTTDAEDGSPVIPSQNLLANVVMKTIHEDLDSNGELSDSESVQSELLLQAHGGISHSRETGYNPTQVLDDLFTRQQTLDSHKQGKEIKKSNFTIVGTKTKNQLMIEAAVEEGPSGKLDTSQTASSSSTMIHKGNNPLIHTRHEVGKDDNLNVDGDFKLERNQTTYKTTVESEANENTSSRVCTRLLQDKGTEVLATNKSTNWRVEEHTGSSMYGEGMDDLVGTRVQESDNKTQEKNSIDGDRNQLQDVANNVMRNKDTAIESKVFQSQKAQLNSEGHQGVPHCPSPLTDNTEVTTTGSGFIHPDFNQRQGSDKDKDMASNKEFNQRQGSHKDEDMASNKEFNRRQGSDKDKDMASNKEFNQRQGSDKDKDMASNKEFNRRQGSDKDKDMASYKEFNQRQGSDKDKDMASNKEFNQRQGSDKDKDMASNKEFNQRQGSDKDKDMASNKEFNQRQGSDKDKDMASNKEFNQRQGSDKDKDMASNKEFNQRQGSDKDKDMASNKEFNQRQGSDKDKDMASNKEFNQRQGSDKDKDMASNKEFNQRQGADKDKDMASNKEFNQRQGSDKDKDMASNKEFNQRQGSDKDMASNKEFIDPLLSKNLHQAMSHIKSLESCPSPDQTAAGEEQVIGPSQESTSSLGPLPIATPSALGELHDPASSISGSRNIIPSTGGDASTLRKSAVKVSTESFQSSSQSSLLTLESLDPAGITSSSTTNKDPPSSGNTSDLFEVEPQSATSPCGLLTLGRLGISGVSAPVVDSLSSTRSRGSTEEADPPASVAALDRTAYLPGPSQPSQSQPSQPDTSALRTEKTTQPPKEELLSSQLLDFIVEFSQVSQTQTDSQYPTSVCRIEDDLIQTITPSIQKSELTKAKLSPFRSSVLSSAISNGQSKVNPSPTENISRSGSESKKPDESPRDKTQTTPGSGSLKERIDEDRTQTASARTSGEAGDCDADSTRHCIENKSSITPRSRSRSRRDMSGRDADSTTQTPQNKTRTHTISGQTVNNLVLSEGRHPNNTEGHSNQTGKLAHGERTPVRSNGGGKTARSSGKLKISCKQSKRSLVQLEEDRSRERTAGNRLHDGTPVRGSCGDKPAGESNSQGEQMSVVHPVHLNITQMKTRYQTLGSLLRQTRDSNTLLCLSAELDQLQTRISTLNEEHKAERSRMFLQVSQPGMSRSQRRQLKMRLQDLGARQKELVEVVQSHKEVKGQVKQQLAVIVRENRLASMKNVNHRERTKPEKVERGKDRKMVEEEAGMRGPVGLPTPVYENIAEIHSEKRHTEYLSDIKRLEVEKTMEANQRISRPVRREISQHNTEVRQSKKRSELGFGSDVNKLKSSTQTHTGIQISTHNKLVTISDVQAASSGEADDRYSRESTVTTAPTAIDLDGVDGENPLNNEMEDRSQTSDGNQPNLVAATFRLNQTNTSPLNNTAATSTQMSLNNTSTQVTLNNNTVSHEDPKAVNKASSSGLKTLMVSAAQSSHLNPETIPAASTSQREALEDSQQDLFSQESEQSRFHVDKSLLDSVINNRTLSSPIQETFLTPSDATRVSGPDSSDQTLHASGICLDSIEITAVTGIQDQTDRRESQLSVNVSTAQVSERSADGVLVICNRSEEEKKTLKEICQNDHEISASEKTLKQAYNINIPQDFVKTIQQIGHKEVKGQVKQSASTALVPRLCSGTAARKKEFVPPATQKQTLTLLQKDTTPSRTADHISVAAESVNIPESTQTRTSATAKPSAFPSASINTPASVTCATEFAPGRTADNHASSLLLSRSVKHTETTTSVSHYSPVPITSCSDTTSLTAITSVSKTPSLLKIPETSILNPQKACKSPQTSTPFKSPGPTPNIILSPPSQRPVLSHKPTLGVISPSSTVASSDIFPVSCREIVKRIETKLGTTNTGSKEHITKQRVEAKLGVSRNTEPKDCFGVPVGQVEDEAAAPSTQIVDVNRQPTFLQPSSLSESRPAVKLDLKTLVETGVLRPGLDIISLCSKGKTYRASLDKKGCIVASGGERFRTPATWYHALTGIVPARRQHVYNKILYKGRPLSVYEAGVKQGESASQNRHKASTAIGKGGNPQAKVATKSNGNLQDTLLTSQPGDKTELGVSSGVVPESVVTSGAEKRLEDTLRGSRCRVWLIADSELVSCPELGDRFWSSDFRDVRMSDSLWDSVTSWN